MKYIFCVIVGIFSGLSCVAPNQTFQKIPPGIWRSVLLLDRIPVVKYGDDRDIVKKFDANSELPFNFEVIYDNDSIFHIVFYNASERIKVTDITFGRDKSTAKDTVIIKFPIYDTQIKAIYEDGVMEGDWIVNYKENYRIPFKAVHGNAQRFMGISDDSTVNVQGKWECKFELGTADEYKAIGIFNQDKDKINGTFLTETGDYRYLEGKVIGSKLFLSTFDGAHAFLFLGKVLSDGTMTGNFRSGSQYTTNWEGKRNENASLSNPYDLTKSSGMPMNFEFINESNQPVSILDEAYKNKVKIVQIMGTWCPNCLDETIFLQDFFKENPDPEVAIISIGFERYKDDKRSLEALKRFKTRMDIKHEVLLGGYFDKKNATLKLPQLDKVMSYPTLIIVDRNNFIKKIHTGFSGPATDGFAKFKDEFKQIISDAKR